MKRGGIHKESIEERAKSLVVLEKMPGTQKKAVHMRARKAFLSFVPLNGRKGDVWVVRR
jgi:hypothetical protein